MNSPVKDIWESVKYFLGVVFFGFLYGIGSLVLLSMLLQWTIGIDITDYDTSYRLLFLFWGVCSVGWHLYHKDQKKKQELETEPQNNEEEFEVLVRLPQDTDLDSKPMSNLEKSDPDKNYMEYKERFSGMTDGQLRNTFSREVGNSGWTSSRSSYLVALREEFEKRKIVITDKKKQPRPRAFIITTGTGKNE